MKKNTRNQTMRLLLYAGALYFLTVAVVHALGVKIPGLYVYFNVPSYAYQDRIISFLAFGWSAFFLLAAKKMDTDLIKLVLFIGLIAIIALIINTVITNFKIMGFNIQVSYFHMITTALFIYWSSLVFFSRSIILKKK